MNVSAKQLRVRKKGGWIRRHRPAPRRCTSERSKTISWRRGRRLLNPRILQRALSRLYWIWVRFRFQERRRTAVYSVGRRPRLRTPASHHVLAVAKKCTSAGYTSNGRDTLVNTHNSDIETKLQQVLKEVIQIHTRRPVLVNA